MYVCVRVCVCAHTRDIERPLYTVEISNFIPSIQQPAKVAMFNLQFFS